MCAEIGASLPSQSRRDCSTAAVARSRADGTQNPSCHVNFHGTDYANWATFASANPTYKMASGYVPFIIADAAGVYDVTHIVLR